MKHITCLIVFVFSCCVLSAQEKSAEKLKLFLDCNTGCDENYFKTEITIVDFVLDRLVADVHLLITSQENGSGGKTFQLIFFGQNDFKLRSDTLLVNLSVTSTEVETRTELLKKIKLGLIPFLANTSYANWLNINMKVSETDAGNITNTQVKDKWNYWVYRIGADGEYDGDEVYKISKGTGNISANRTTERFRVNFSAYGNFSSKSYTYADSTGTLDFRVINSNYYFDHYLVKSLSEHWSIGYELNYSNSTFSNNRSQKYISTGIEYAIFPYREVNNKFFAISYSVDLSQNKYYDTTIYNKISELFAGHKLVANLSLKQKWGTFNGQIIYRNYFKDWKLNNLFMNIKMNVRITGGLSFYIYSSLGLVHDQVYLIKGNATAQEILTKQRELASTYVFYSGVGLSFRFGSIHNNFVNPRFSNY